MKKYALFCILLILLVSGCSQDKILLDESKISDGRVFTTSLQSGDSRTYVENGRISRWTADDRVSIFDGNTLNRHYKFDGETGDNSGTFSIVDNPYGTGVLLPANYAVYPYASDIKISDDGVITATLPAVQHYAPNSFGLEANTMVAVTHNIHDTFLLFKNVGGSFKFQLYGDDVTVKSITLTGNNGEKIAGKASITAAYDKEPGVDMSETAGTSITLDCGEKGVKIGSSAEDATTFWMVVPPTKFEKGVTITVKGMNGAKFVNSTSHSLVIERNVVKPMAALEVEMTAPEQTDAPFVIKQKNYSLSPKGSRFVVDIEYNQPYKILKKSNGIADYTSFDNGINIIKEDGHDKMMFMAFNDGDLNHKEIIISDEAGVYTDTINISLTNESEQLHGGNGNGLGSSTAIMNYKGVTPYFDVHTNLDNYEILIFGNTETHKAQHVRTDKMDFGFREYIQIPINDSGKDIELGIAFVGPNITHLIKVIHKRQLFVYIDEPEEMHISKDGSTFTTHAWTEDDNLNIRLEGTDTSWLTVKQTDDTYENGVRRINTTFEAEPNKTGSTREIRIVAYNGFNDNDAVRVIQPSGEGVLLSKEKMIIGAWENSQAIKLQDCEYTITTTPPVSWISMGTKNKENGIIIQNLQFKANKDNVERNAELVINSGNITHTIKIRQLPESGSTVDDSSDRWKSFALPAVNVKQPYPYETGSMLYFAIVENPEEFIRIQSRKVLDLLYFSPEDQFVPKLNYLEYVLDNYDGISYCGGGGGMKLIALSNQYVESYYNTHGAQALVKENKGVLSHELTHAFQLEPKGCGDYGSSNVFHSCVEGMADAVRVLSGGFPNANDRPRGGHYLNSYRYTGFFIAWLVNNKDKDFLRKFNLSTQYVNPWSFDGAIKYVLGNEYNVDSLWNEYLKAMGDI